MIRRTALLVVLALGATACGSQTATEAAPDVDYSSARVAPLPSQLPNGGSDETPGPEDSLVELDLDSGATAALWIDPDDIASVYVQYSDPEDDSAWTEPTLVHEAGDGCLTLRADSSGSTIAVGLGCYQTDAFVQQAPDEAVVAVSTDLETWDVEQVGESIPVPEVSADGDSAVFRNDVYDGQVDARWKQGAGFS